MSFSSCSLLISPGGDRWALPLGVWLKVASSLEQRAEQLGEGNRNRRFSRHRPTCALGSESSDTGPVGQYRRGMQPDQTAFLRPALSGPSIPLISNKVISLQVPILLAMAMAPNHFEILSSSPPPVLPSLVHLPPLGSVPRPSRGQMTIVFHLLCQDPPYHL